MLLLLQLLFLKLLFFLLFLLLQTQFQLLLLHSCFFPLQLLFFLLSFNLFLFLLFSNLILLIPPPHLFLLSFFFPSLQPWTYSVLHCVAPNPVNLHSAVPVAFCMQKRGLEAISIIIKSNNSKKRYDDVGYG